MHITTLVLFAASLSISYFLLQRLHHVLYRQRELFRYPSLTLLAPFTNLAYVAHIALLRGRSGTEILHEKHRTAPVIRLGPNRLSFSDPAAIKDIYGTNTLCSKGDQYSTPGGTPNLLSVVDREWHSIKRKRMSAAFATVHLLDWQEKVVDRLQALLSVMDGYCAEESIESDRTFDLRYWSHLFTLDTIMSIALSYKSSFLENGSDMTTVETVDGEQQTVHLRDCLFAVNRSLGATVWSKAAFPWLRKLSALHPWAKRQLHLASQWRDVTRFLQRDRVKRYEQGEPLDDLFSCLLEDKSGRELRLVEEELVAETGHLGMLACTAECQVCEGKRLTVFCS